jgi:asparagine synthase (glutamine-hydrolysing)
MCGIVGICLSDQRTTVVDRAVVDGMRDELSHRGPDGAGTWISPDGRVGLGHRRLSIIDLSEAASQPMSNADGSLWIVFNGEIYNHAELRAELQTVSKSPWKTDHSDTEVILQAFEQWGIECLHKFRGMFAFALWDGRSRDLWLVRDRIGIKPLYYAYDSSFLAFASEIKGLLRLPGQQRVLDEEALFYYLSFLTVPAPKTLFRGIQKLAPGCWLRMRADGSVTQHRYWDVLDHLEGLDGATEDELAHRVVAELRTSVRLRQVSDVPVGAFLSGGIDSSTNVALLSESSRGQLNTFTVGFSGQSTYANETHQARRIADLFGARYHEQLLSEDDIIEFLPRMVYLQDEPIADPVCVPIHYLSRQARTNGVIVCQVGEGSDELFWGYPRWRTIAKLQAIGDLPLPGLLKRAAGTLLHAAGRGASREYEFLHRSQVGVPVFWSGAEAFTGAEKSSLLHERLRSRFSGMSGWDALAPTYARFRAKAEGRLSPLSWMTYADLNLRLPELLLMRVDKMSMGQGIECRVPFLDHRFVELAMSIPERIKSGDGTPKYLMKKAVRGLIPDATIERPKQGFGVPIEEWVLRKLGATARSAIRDMVRQTELLDSAEVERVLESGRASRVWFLLNLALWWKRFLG